jgi:hypothetical protein
MVHVEPKRRRVETSFVGLASATYPSEIADELEGGERVVGPGQFEPLGQGLGWGIGHDVEEEVQARVAGGEVGGRAVLGVAHGGCLVGGFVVVGDHEVQEWVTSVGSGFRGMVVELRGTKKTQLMMRT